MLRSGSSGRTQPSKLSFILVLVPLLQFTHLHGSTCFNTLRRFLAAEEEIITPYRFGVYDLLVLPPSFPYGGMVSKFQVACGF